MKKLSAGLLLISLIILLANAFRVSAVQDDDAGRVKKTPGAAPSAPAKKGGGRIKASTPATTPRPKSGGSGSNSSSAELTVSTNQPGSTVLIDNQPKGSTNASGSLKIPRLKPGTYTVTVRKPNFQEENRMVEVVAGKQTANFTLSPMPGKLRVSSTVAGASIEVNGIAYPDGAEIPLTPGPYRIAVSKPGYRTATREITIVSGKLETHTITPEPLPVDEMFKQGEASFNQSNFSEASNTFRAVLSVQPEHPRANLLMGYSTFATGDFSGGVNYWAKAITLGEKVLLPAQRHTKSGILGQIDGLTPGLLVIGKDLFEFRTGGGAPVFSVPFNKIYRILVETNRGGRLQVKVGDPNKKKDGGKDYNFHPPQARLRDLDPGNASSPVTIYCDNCMPMVEAFYQLLQRVTQAR